MGLLDFLKGLLGGPGKKQSKKKQKKRNPGGAKAFRRTDAPSSSKGGKAKGGQFARKASGPGTDAPRRARTTPLVDPSSPPAPRRPTEELEVTVPAAGAETAATEAAPPRKGTGGLDPRMGTGSLDPAVAEAYEDPQPPKKSGFFGFGGKKEDKKSGQLLKEIEPNIGRGDVIGIKLKLEDYAATAASYRLAAEEKAKNLGSARTHLKGLTDELNYQAIAMAAATLAGDAGFLADPVVKKAGEVIDLMPFVLKAAKSKKSEVYSLVHDFEKILGEFNQGLADKAAYLDRAGDDIMKALAAKDFAKVTGLAEAIVRDAEILAHQFDSAIAVEGSGDQGLTAAGAQEKWKDIDKQVLQLSQVLLSKQYRFASDLAKIVFASAGCMGDPAFQKAVELIKGGKQLLQAFREQKVALVGKMATSLTKQASVFNAPLMARTNQIAEQVAQIEKLQKEKEYDKLCSVATAISRTAALLVDPTIKRASLLSGDLSKVEVYIKRKDFAGALNTLTSSIG